MRRSLALAVWGVWGAGLAVAAEPPAASLDRESVPAAGRQSAIVTVSRFGRYAVAATSAQGTSVQLVDRMAGPGDVGGEPGVRDGRLDLFLDRGQYKLLVRGHEAATGAARLVVSAFVEKNARPPRLVELKPVAGELRDLEQRSYWIEIAERRTVWLEAAGRALSDLRLWREGEWLVDAPAEREYVQPKTGQPVFVYRIAAALDRGLYLLTAYGGVPQPWSDGDAFPFHLRFGIPALGEPTRARHEVGPFGIDRYRIPAVASFFRVELPEAAPLVARVGLAGGPAFADAAEGELEVTKKTVPPAAELEVGSREEGERFVTVRGEPGQAYVLQAFQRADEYQFTRSGAHWISTVHSGDPADSVDATAILVEWRTGDRPQPVHTGVVALDSKTRWTRRANLLAPLTVFFQVKEAGAYTITSTGTTARFRLEPFLIQRPARYQPPPLRDSGARWDLDAGLYVLTVEPVRKGIVEVQLQPAVSAAASVAAEAAQGAVAFPETTLRHDHRYTVYVNRRPGIATGLVLRPVPLDLTDPLPLVLRAGETARVPFEAGERGGLSAIGEDGTRLSLSLDDGPWQESVSVAPGRHVVVVKGAARPRPVSLHLVPESQDPASPLPALPDATLAAVPKWPIVTEDAPRHFDLVRRASATFNVRADTAGLYRLETTGLLAMKGFLRTRTVTSFAQAEGNGTGRNALLQHYLREGDYQVTVAAQGESAGRAGLVLSRGTPAAGGFLTSGMPARATLRASDSVGYRFNITRPGRFRVRAFGLAGPFRMRLEDLDGWPVVAPGIEADVTHDFDPGKYRLVVLPQPTDARVLTVIEPVRARREVKGHGPHRLRLGESIEHVWTEPEEGQPRVPDVWEWTVPAHVTARLQLTGEMQGELVRADAAGREVVATLPPARGWTGRLEPGRYRLEAVCSRRNNRVPYEVALTTEELVAGQDRAVSAPIDMPVSVGAAGLVEISSFGGDDVRARLYDAGGRLIARGDDRPDDWNFLLVQDLAPGAYRLRVDPVGGEAAQTRVSFRVPRDDEQPPLALPAALDVTVGRTSRLYPLTIAEGSELVVIEARSPTSVGVALETAEGGAWRQLASGLGRRPRIAVPLATAEGKYRLRVWSADRREATLRLAAAAPAPVAVDEAQLRKGLTLTAATGLTGAAVRVGLDRPGLLRLGGDVGALWCEAPGRACRAREGDVVSAGDRRSWLVADVAAGRTPMVRGERVLLGDGQSVTVRLPPAGSAVCDLRDHDGLVLVTASSHVATPGIAVSGPDDSGPSAMAVGPQTSLTLARSPRSALARVWNASGTAAIEVTLGARHAARPNEVALEAGRWEGAVDTPTTVRLGGGVKRARLALGDGVVAAVFDGRGRPRSVHAGAGRAVVEGFDTDADALTLLSTAAGARADVSLVPLGKGHAATVGAGTPYERRHAESGTVRIPVTAASGDRLHVRGAEDEATFVALDGRVRRGRDFEVGPGEGTLLVPHAPGWLLAWVDRAGEEADGLWTSRGDGTVRKLEPPALADLEATPRFAIEVSQPSALHFRSASPLVTRVTRAGATPQVELHSASTALDVYLAPGRTTVEARALGGGPATGTAEVTQTSVTRVGEGLGPEVLLAPGATRLFAFDVPAERAIGIGVRASTEVVEATLLDFQGAAVGHGSAQMRTLAAGSYLLALHNPADGVPAVARPSVVGLTAPDTGPPEDVVQQYLAPEEPGAAFTSTRVDSRTPGRRWYGDRDRQSTEGELDPATEWEGGGEGEGDLSEEMDVPGDEGEGGQQ